MILAVFDEVRTIELKEGGADIAVTNDNRREYVDLYVHWFLDQSVEREYAAFARGVP
jgi:hypothetical protein